MKNCHRRFSYIGRKAFYIVHFLLDSRVSLEAVLLATLWSFPVCSRLRRSNKKRFCIADCQIIHYD